MAFVVYGRGTLNPPIAPYPPQRYLATHRGSPGDVAFYRTACAGSARVLELGCGGGRMLKAIAQTGASIVGLENHPELVMWARRATQGHPNVEVVQGDMRDFRVSGPFDRIVLPFNGLYCLLSDEEVLACWSCVAEHLADDGLLVFDAYAADGFHQTADTASLEDPWDAVDHVTVDGVAYEVLERSVWDPPAQRLDTYYAYRRPGCSADEQYHIAHRYLLQHQVAPLLRRVGLEPWVFHGDFDQSVYRVDSPKLIVTAHRAS